MKLLPSTRKVVDLQAQSADDLWRELAELGRVKLQKPLGRDPFAIEATLYISQDGGSVSLCSSPSSSIQGALADLAARVRKGGRQ